MIVSLKAGSKYNLLAIVKDYKISEKVIILYVFDEKASLICNVFLPVNNSIIRKNLIVCFHRLKIEEYLGTLVGVAIKGTSIMFYDEDDCNLEPFYSMPINSLPTAEDKTRLIQLKDWYQNISLNSLSLSQVVTKQDKYFDYYGILIGFCKLDSGIHLVYISNGKTFFKQPLKWPVLSENENLRLKIKNSTQNLMIYKELYQKYVVPIYVYDEYNAICLKANLGDVLSIHNIHLSFVKNSNMLYECILHGGGINFGRTIKLYKHPDYFHEEVTLSFEAILKNLKPLNDNVSKFSNSDKVQPYVACNIEADPNTKHEQGLVNNCKNCNCLVQRFDERQIKITVTTNIINTYPNSLGINNMFPQHTHNKHQQTNFSYIKNLSIKEAKDVQIYNLCCLLISYSPDLSFESLETVLAPINVYCQSCGFWSKCPINILSFNKPTQLPTQSQIEDTEDLARLNTDEVMNKEGPKYFLLSNIPITLTSPTPKRVKLDKSRLKTPECQIISGCSHLKSPKTDKCPPKKVKKMGNSKKVHLKANRLTNHSTINDSCTANIQESSDETSYLTATDDELLNESANQTMLPWFKTAVPFNLHRLQNQYINYLASFLPEGRDDLTGKQDTSLPLYYCPKCKTQDLGSKSILRYAFAFDFVLQDSATLLTSALDNNNNNTNNIYNKDTITSSLKGLSAQTFFKGVTPEMYLASEGVREELKRQLEHCLLPKDSFMFDLPDGLTGLQVLQLPVLHCQLSVKFKQPKKFYIINTTMPL